MARVLATLELSGGAAQALAGHDVVIGPPGSDADCEALICAPVETVDAAAMAAMPCAPRDCRRGAGTDAIDAAAAAERGIVVIASPDPLVETTADVAFGLIIPACRRFTAAT